jgi:catechol 2,3-dioxygenase-like lactoylglutathione lyase family enzyme
MSNRTKQSTTCVIEGIDRITYCTDGSAENFAQAKQFFLDWGLTLTSDFSDALMFETLNGAQVRVLTPAHADLQGLPAIENGATLREVVWGITSGKIPAQHADPHGLVHRFQPSQKRTTAFKGSPSNVWGDERRINAPSQVYERATPVEIGHIVLFTQRLDEAVAFYETLGFVLSDSYPRRGAFLRCAQSAGHHDVFLLQLPGGKQGLNHVAFTVRDIHEVFGGGLAMSRAGWTTQLGPGRHPVSSAYFWYFNCPVGGLIEYNADEDHLTAAWQPREFTPGPTVFAEWAIDGGIDGHTRRQPQMAAGGQFLTEKRH